MTEWVAVCLWPGPPRKVVISERSKIGCRPRYGPPMTEQCTRASADWVLVPGLALVQKIDGRRAVDGCRAHYGLPSKMGATGRTLAGCRGLCGPVARSH